VRWTRDPTPGPQHKGSRTQHPQHKLTGLDRSTTEEDPESRPWIGAASEEEEGPGSMPRISAASEEEDPGAMPGISTTSAEEDPRTMRGICNEATTEEVEGGPGFHTRDLQSFHDRKGRKYKDNRKRQKEV
jgi:hypothetical protein